MWWKLFGLVAFSLPAGAMDVLPQMVASQLPAKHEPIATKSADFDGNGLFDYLVVLARKGEAELVGERGAPARPLLIFLQRSSGVYSLHARNDWVVHRANEGGQCDPFLDSGEGLAAKGRFFTVENGVACGDHWSDFVTFKYASESGDFVFHKRVREQWAMKPSARANEDALVLRHRTVEQSKVGAPILLKDYRPSP